MATSTVPVRLPRGSNLQFLRQLSRHPAFTSSALQLALHQPRGVFSIVAAARTDDCHCQRRHQSTAGTPGSPNYRRLGDNGSKPPPPPPPRQTLTRVLLRGLWASFRSLGAPFRLATIRRLYRENPIELVLALGVLACLVAVVGYASSLYFTYFFSPQFTRYPEPIAKAMRKALYYSNYNPDPKRALKYYRQALELCDELRLDPFSDDVMGIKIQLAAWLEKVENYENAARVLDALLEDCKRWVGAMEAAAKDGSLAKLMPVALPAEPDASAPAPAGAAEPPETAWGKRTRVLGKAVGISVKLASLYSDEHLAQQDRAHERLVWAVETVLGELQRRTAEGLKDGEGGWMTPEQIGGTLESLGHSYELKSQFHLALPLFFQALRMSDNQCHSAVLMNNIAACFAQHPLLPVGEAPTDAQLAEALGSQEKATPAERRTSYLQSAERWAKNAKQHASEPQGDQRTAECDEACAVALCNLAHIANLSGNTSKARQQFEQAVELSKKIGFAQGVSQAQDGLRALLTLTS